jgi:hypothetical protein
MVEAGSGAETEVTPCLELYRRGSKNPIDRDVIQITRERRSDWEIRIELEENFAHACVKEHLIDLAVSHIAISVEHDNNLLTSQNPLPYFFGQILEKG